MRAYEEILTQIANEHSYETWYELMRDSKAHWQIHCTKQAMEIASKELAEEALSFGYHTAKDEAKGERSAGYATRFFKRFKSL